MDMFKHIKEELSGDIKKKQKNVQTYNYNSNDNGLNILMNYIPVINENPSIQYTYNDELEDIDNDIENTKKIRYNKK